jgi:hypothetical protein
MRGSQGELPAVIASVPLLCGEIFSLYETVGHKDTESTEEEEGTEGVLSRNSKP